MIKAPFKSLFFPLVFFFFATLLTLLFFFSSSFVCCSIQFDFVAFLFSVFVFGIPTKQKEINNKNKKRNEFSRSLTGAKRVFRCSLIKILLLMKFDQFQINAMTRNTQKKNAIRERRNKKTKSKRTYWNQSMMLSFIEWRRRRNKNNRNNNQRQPIAFSMSQSSQQNDLIAIW